MTQTSSKKNWIDEIPEGTTSRIIKRILPLMPSKGQNYTDEQAAWMVNRMNEIVEEEFKDDPFKKSQCSNCGDSGYVWVWVQLVKGINYKGNEVVAERVPHSPIWITKFGVESPNPELELTHCVARCACKVGQWRKEKNPGIPSMDSFKPIAI